MKINLDLCATIIIDIVHTAVAARIAVAQTWINPMDTLIVCLLSILLVGITVLVGLTVSAATGLIKELGKFEWFQRMYGSPIGGNLLLAELIGGRELERLLRDRPDIILMLRTFRKRMLYLACSIACWVFLVCIVSVLRRN